MLPAGQEDFCYQSGDFIMFIENRIFNYYDIIITQIREAFHIFCFFFAIDWSVKSTNKLTGTSDHLQFALYMI